MMEQINPKVSVILPCFNVERYISKCLDSLIANEYNNKEIIIINDGSTDSTLNIIEGYSEKYNCIKLVSQSNAGVYAARNLGLKLATGKYLMFADPDDYVEPNFFQVAADNLESTQVDMLLFGFNTDWTGKFEPAFPLELYDIHSNAEIISKVFPRFYGVSATLFNAWIKDEKELIEEKETGQLWRVAFRMDFIREHNIIFPNVNVGGDVIFNLECLLSAKSIKGINTPLYNYIPRKDGLMYSNINGFKTYTNKINTLNERIRIGELLEKKVKIDSLDLYAGSCVLSCFELANILSKSRDFKSFLEYCHNETVQKSIKKCRMGGTNMKKNMPLLLLKTRLYRLLYFVFCISNKLKFKISY